MGDVSEMSGRRWHRFVALGDSFTEGLADDRRADGRHRGWADRVAEHLSASAPGTGDSREFSYANLAIRGRLLPQVVAEQVPLAVSMEPDLVSLGAGVNDALRRHFDVNALATDLENAARTLRATGADVLLFAFGDPGRRSRAMGPIRHRIRSLNTAVHAIAAQYGCFLVDFWGVAAYDDDRLWDDDRLHLSPEGHELAARTALSALGMAPDDWRTPTPLAERASLTERTAAHVRWLGSHAGPWIARRARGESSGDAITAKDPQLRRIGPSIHR